MQTASNDIKARPTRCGRGGVRVTRTVLVTAVCAVGVASASWVLWLAWLSAWSRVAAPGPASTGELLAIGVASAAIAIAAWLFLGAALEVLSHLPGRWGDTARRWADRLTPVLARRVAAFVLGVGVGVAGGPSQAVGASRDLGSLASASAAPAPGFDPAPAPAGRAAPFPGFEPRIAPAPGFTPARTPGHGDLTAAATETFPAPPAPGFTPSAPRVRKQADPTLLGARATTGDRAGADRTDTGEVVVHRGDSLWSIAAAHLGPDADDAEVARAWPRWFEANRHVIGDDPDHLLPGQVLRVPDQDASSLR